MTASATSQASAMNRFFRDPETGRQTVVQLPNAPLWGWLAATLVRIVLHPSGTTGSVVSAVGTLSLAIWAVLELARGDSPFRRVLGGLVLVGVAVSQVMRLG